MKKVGQLILIFAFVVFCYLFMMALQPFTNAVVESTNSTIAAASSNWTNYKGAQAVLVGWPFWAYLIPASFGAILTVGVLRSE